MSKEFHIYGAVRAYEKDITFRNKRRRLKTRVDGVKQHYWVNRYKRNRNGEVIIPSARFELYGNGKDLAYAMAFIKSSPIVPEGHVSVSAASFLANPYRYGVRGFWIWQEEASR